VERTEPLVSVRLNAADGLSYRVLPTQVPEVDLGAVRARERASVPWSPGLEGFARVCAGFQAALRWALRV
jgi:hypothetical protein